jgi:hypothetical protein
LEAEKNRDTGITATPGEAAGAQGAVTELDPTDTRSIAKLGPSAGYAGPLVQAAVTHAIFFLIGGFCVMDMGETQRAVVIASIPFWLTALVISYRNPRTPSVWARLFIRWGLIPIMIAGTFLLEAYARSLLEFGHGFK